jgi:threonine dehydratase
MPVSTPAIKVDAVRRLGGAGERGLLPGCVEEYMDGQPDNRLMTMTADNARTRYTHD